MQRAKRVGWMKLLDVLTEIRCKCVQKNITIIVVQVHVFLHGK